MDELKVGLLTFNENNIHAMLDERVVMFQERDALQARAEAAEKLLSAPDKVIDNMTAVISERIAAESALAAAQAQVAELKAQLAAQAWRPVAEQEPPQGQNVIGKQYIESPPCIVSLDFDPMDNEWIWQDVDGVSYHYDSINYWRPIDPPAPA